MSSRHCFFLSVSVFLSLPPTLNPSLHFSNQAGSPHVQDPINTGFTSCFWAAIPVEYGSSIPKAPTKVHELSPLSWKGTFNLSFVHSSIPLSSCPSAHLYATLYHVLSFGVPDTAFAFNQPSFWTKFFLSGAQRIQTTSSAVASTHPCSKTDAVKSDTAVFYSPRNSLYWLSFPAKWRKTWKTGIGSKKG